MKRPKQKAGRVKGSSGVLVSGLLAAILVMNGCSGDADEDRAGTGGASAGGASAASGGVAQETGTGTGGDSPLLPLGSPCVPSSEFEPGFSGLSIDEINLAAGDLTCQSELCLAHNFQGRTSCPYGQSEEDLSLPPEDGRRCRLPEGATATSDVVERSVQPQYVSRRAEDVVICSCRCAGPDPDADYCECAEDMECVELVDDLGIGRNEIAGSYCIHAGTRFDEADAPGPVCSTTSTAPETDCGNDRSNP